MKKILQTLALTLLTVSSLLFVPMAVYAAVDVISPVCDGKNGIDESQICKDNLTDPTDPKFSNPIFGPQGILTKSISIISIIVSIVSVIIIIIAGIKFITSQGNPQSVSTARNQIIYAVIGLVVALIAQGLVAFILKRL